MDDHKVNAWLNEFEVVKAKMSFIRQRKATENLADLEVSINPPVCPSIRLFVRPSVHPSVCSFVRLSVRLWV